MREFMRKLVKKFNTKNVKTRVSCIDLCCSTKQESLVQGVVYRHPDRNVFSIDSFKYEFSEILQSFQKLHLQNIKKNLK